MHSEGVGLAHLGEGITKPIYGFQENSRREKAFGVVEGAVSSCASHETAFPV